MSPWAGDAAAIWRSLCGLALALLPWTWREVRAEQGTAGAGLAGTAYYLWPIHFSTAPLTSKNQVSLDAPQLGQELRDIGLARFEEYLSKTLPQELQLDSEFAEEFHSSDHKRVNLAFNRWQKRAFAEAQGVPVEEILQRGERVPKLEGVNYSWPELYTSKAFHHLRKRIAEFARLYNRRSGHKPQSLADSSRFRIFTWVEAFGKGDAMSPMSRTESAYMMGRYFAAGSKGAVKLNFEDPRGINPPYGKTFSHTVYDGNIVMYPTWVSQFVTPNMFNTTVVCYSFLVYPENGRSLRWEDDPTANLIVTRSFQATKSQTERK